MSVVSDALDSLETWFKNFLIGGIDSVFDNISNLLTDTFDQTTGSNGLATIFLSKHPAKFTGMAGNAPAEYGIWATIENLCNSVVVPIAGFILTIILLNDLIQMVMRGNNFKDFDDSIFIKWIIKAVCGVLLVSNTYYIASALFSFGTDVCAKGLTTLFGSSSTTSTLSLNTSAMSGLSLGELLVTLLIAAVVNIGMLLLIVAIIITLASRIIEIFMYLSISPIPMATMMDSGGEWSSIGKNWIKQILALSFQGFFIVVALAIFKTLFNNMIVSLNAGSDGIMMQMGLLLGYTCALIFTVLRTGAISKSVFNAH